MTTYYGSQQGILTDKDACPLSEWSKKSEQYSFAIHPKGFPIFLKPSEIEKSDEYADSDPYQVETGINSAFQQNRFLLTLDMLHECIATDKKTRILDIACGEGHITAQIAQAFPQAELSGLDYSVSAIERAFELYAKHDIDFIVANAHKPPYPPNHFDIIVCNNIWEHIADPILILQGLLAVMKPSAYLIISTPSRYRLYNLLRVLLGKPIQFMSKFHVTEYTVGQVLEQLNFCDMELISIKTKPISVVFKSPQSIIINKIIYPVLRNYLKLLGSHHSLESTVFYLAKKRD
jgi:2-polyprenyl-3-methyl-5-hydroxy-6-metoxy-1,4-benzoquinol methylase